MGAADRSDYGPNVTLALSRKPTAMSRTFCWLPTNVYSSEWMRDGFRWLTFVSYCADSGKHYTVPTSAQSIAADYRRNFRIGLELAALVVVCVVWAVQP